MNKSKERRQETLGYEVMQMQREKDKKNTAKILPSERDEQC